MMQATERHRRKRQIKSRPYLVSIDVVGYRMLQRSQGQSWSHIQPQLIKVLVTCPAHLVELLVTSLGYRRSIVSCST